MIRVKSILVILAIILGINVCYADTMSELTSGIEAYKRGNYADCITKLNLTLKSDPTLAIGYYYLALAYSKTGKEDLAELNYNKVINLGSDNTLADLSRKAKSVINSKKVVIEVNTESGDSDIESDEDNPILNDGVVQKEESSQPQTKSAKTETKKEQKQVVQQAKFEFDGSREPTNDEILTAIKILQKVGLLQNGASKITGANQPNQQPQAQNPYQQNQYQQQMPYADARTQQLNSMLMMMNNGNNNNGMMNMMPYMQQNGKVDPQLMQMMLMQQMMPNFSNGNNNNGY